jgi:hypothetical protein
MNAKNQFLRVSSVSGFGVDQVAGYWGELNDATDFPLCNYESTFARRNFKDTDPSSDIVCALPVKVHRVVEILQAKLDDEYSFK